MTARTTEGRPAERDALPSRQKVVAAKYVAGYLRRPHRIERGRIDDVPHTRFDVYADRQRGDWFACGERLQGYAMTQAGSAEPTAVHLWIEDEFLVDERSADGEAALLETIARNAARHEESDEREIGVLIPAKLERQYLLDWTGGAGGPVRLRVDLYRDLSSKELFATAERRAWYEVRRFGCARLEHVAFWARDKAACTLIEDIEAADSGAFMAEAQERIARSFRIDSVTCSRRDHRYVLAPFEVEEAGMEDEFERLDVRIDVMAEAAAGRLWCAAQERATFELQPVGHDRAAHESVLVDDAVTGAMIRRLSAADPDALAEAAAAAIGSRYRELRLRA